jgi:hypothetical protein
MHLENKYEQLFTISCKQKLWCLRCQLIRVHNWSGVAGEQTNAADYFTHLLQESVPLEIMKSDKWTASF